MQWVRMIVPGLKAAGAGATAGTAALALIAIAMIAYEGPAGGGLVEIFLIVFAASLFVQFFCALGGLLVVGVPFTLWLKDAGKENRFVYLVVGFLAGGVIASFVLASLGMRELSSLAFYVFPSAVNGGATAWFWWRLAREKLAFADFDPLLETFE